MGSAHDLRRSDNPICAYTRRCLLWACKLDAACNGVWCFILVYLLEILGSKNIRISSVLKYVHTLAECDDVKVDTFWNQILNRRTRSFMWNIRGVTEYESFSFIMEPTHFNMSKLNNPSQLDPEDIKVVLSLHNDSYRTNSNQQSIFGIRKRH